MNNPLPQYPDNMQENEISVFDILSIVLRYKILIISLFLIGIVIGYSRAVVLYTKTYKSTGVILLGNPMSYSVKTNSDLASTNVIASTYETVIYSNDTLKSILMMEVSYKKNGADKKSSLLQYFACDVAAGMPRLKSSITLELKKNTLVLKISATDKDPDIASFIVDAYITKLNAFYTSQLSSNSQTDIKKIDDDMDKAKIQLDNTKQNLLKFRQTNKLITDPNPLPKLKYLEEKLLMQVNEKEQLYKGLFDRYNSLKLKGDYDLTLLTVLEKPQPADRPLPRGGAKKAAIGGFIGLLIAGGYIFLVHFLKMYKDKLRKEKEYIPTEM
jgi:uncharacterized protein involved in exopolysaccharide biosynthesis